MHLLTALKLYLKGVSSVYKMEEYKLPRSRNVNVMSFINRLLLRSEIAHKIPVSWSKVLQKQGSPREGPN